MYLTKKIYWPLLFIFDHIFFVNKKQRPYPDNPRKVLFIRLEHIGDMVLASQTFETFKKNNPTCQVHVLCRNLTKPLAECNPSVDRVITYDATWLGRRNGEKRGSLRNLIQTLRKEKYDVVFEMHGDPRNNYLAYETGAYTLGYDCRGGGFFLNKVISYDPHISVIQQNQKLIENYGKDFGVHTRLFTDDISEKKAADLMNLYDLQQKGFLIVNPLSGRKEKDLTKEEVEKILVQYKDHKIILTGSADQKEFCEQFVGEHVYNVCGQTDVLTLAALVKKAKKVVAPDTGIIHMAKAAGTDFEAIYKTTNRIVWGYV